MHHVAANDRTTATVVVIGEDRKGGWIGTRPRIIEDGVALILRPAEIRALGRRSGKEINFLLPVLTYIADGDLGTIEGKTPRIAQTIGEDLRLSFAIARKRVVRRDSVFLSGILAVDIDAQDFAHQLCDILSIALG